MPIDDTDRKIISLLQEDGRRSMADIARNVGLSRVAVRERYQHLRASNVIQGVSAIVRSEAIDLNVNAFLEIEIEPSRMDEICEILAKIDEVTIVYQMTGNTALHVHCYAKSTDDLAVFLTRQVYVIPGVHRVTSNILLKRFKSDLSIR